MSQLKANSILRLTILVLLYDQPYCGYELIQSVNRITGRKTSTGSVYPFLQELMTHNYLTYDSEIITSKSKKSYTLTAEGKIFAQNSLVVVKKILDLFKVKCIDYNDDFLVIDT